MINRFEKSINLTDRIHNSYENIIKINENKKNVEFNNPIEILLLEQPEYYLLLVHEQDQTSGESSIHYTNYIKKGEVKDNQEYLDNLAESLTKELVPDVNEIGYITIDDTNYKYPVFYSSTYDYFIIRSGDLFLMK